MRVLILGAIVGLFQQTSCASIDIRTASFGTSQDSGTTRPDPDSKHAVRVPTGPFASLGTRAAELSYPPSSAAQDLHSASNFTALHNRRAIRAKNDGAIASNNTSGGISDDVRKRHNSALNTPRPDGDSRKQLFRRQATPSSNFTSRSSERAFGSEAFTNNGARLSKQTTQEQQTPKDLQLYGAVHRMGKRDIGAESKKPEEGDKSLPPFVYTKKETLQTGEGRSNQPKVNKTTVGSENTARGVRSVVAGTATARSSVETRAVPTTGELV